MRRRARALALLVAALSLAPAGGAAQIAVTNLLDVQNGNVPFSEPSDRVDLYNRLDLDYRFASGQAGLRFETNRNSEDELTYAEITHRYAEWSDGGVGARVGNLYTILGRGLVHRSFELPGVVLEQVGLRSRYSPSRDVDGAFAEGRWRLGSLRLLAGRPNSGEFSPAGEEAGFVRYSGFLTGGQAVLTPVRQAKIGATYSRLSDGGSVLHEAGSGFVEFDPLRIAGARGVSAPLYLEYARREASFSDWWRFETDDGTGHALYLAGNFLWGPLGLSAEWKDYADFRLGTNDPPSLVREHAPALLNRNTHVLNAGLEEGHQIEASLAFPRWGSAIVNWSRSDGRFASGPVRFEERYAELHTPPRAGAHWEASAFFAEGEDEFVGIDERDLYGAAATVIFAKGYSVTLDAQRQEATRLGQDFDDTYLGLTLARSEWGSAGAVWERTNDPEQEDPEKADDAAIDPRHFFGAIFQVRLTERHEASLFYGERRGGRACTAGTCYEVLPFKGAELRLMTAF